MTGRVIVVGSVNVDLVARVDHLPAAGETVGGATFERHPGGKGGNQAAAAARLGARVAFIGAIGADPFGEEARSALEDEGIDLSGVWPAVEQRIVRSDRRGVWGRVPRRLPMWGAAAAAIAAGALLWFRTPPPEPVRVTHARPNQAVIERLVSSQGSRVGIMKDRKYGTTLIMVSAPGEDAGQ